MTKSHSKSISVKAHSYGGINFLANQLPDLVCFKYDGEIGCAIKTYEYLWGAQLATFQMCAQNWLVDRSYNYVAVESQRGYEVQPFSYDITKDEVMIVSFDIGSVTYDPFTIKFELGTWYSSDNCVITCMLEQNIYGQEDKYTNGYHLQFPWFGVPYCLKLNESFQLSISAGAKVIYRGTGTPTTQTFYFHLYEYDGDTDSWTLLHSSSKTASSGDKITFGVPGDAEIVFKKDLTLYSMVISHYNPSLGGTQPYYILYWRIKEADFNFADTIYIYTEKP